MSGEITAREYPTAGVASRDAILASVDLGNDAALKTSDCFTQVGPELGVPIWSNSADLYPVRLHDNLGNGKIWTLPV